MTGKANEFHGSHINIEGTLIRWEKHTCVISAISHIWIGVPVEGKWGGSKGVENEGLNVGLHSGIVYSFFNSNHDFLMQAYETLCSLMEEENRKGKNTLDFEHNIITIYEESEEPEEEKEEAPELLQETSYSENNPIKQELQVLMEHCKKKENAGTAVWQLLDDIISYYEGKNSLNIQDMYRLFIQLSLVNECNELGLNGLIEEVKSKIYQ